MRTVGSRSDVAALERSRITIVDHRHAVRMRDFLRKQRARVGAQGVRKTLLYYLFTVVLERLGVELMYVFEYVPRNSAEPDCAGTTTGIVDSPASLTAADRQALEEYGGPDLLREFAAAFARGEKCAVTRLRNHLASVCWLVPVSSYYPDPTSACLLIERCFTLPNLRGHGLYPILLSRVGSLLRSSFEDPRRVFVKSSMFNESSIRGIQKAGFKRIGRLVSFGRSEWYRPFAEA